jgi:hypothetical protein
VKKFFYLKQVILDLKKLQNFMLILKIRMNLGDKKVSQKLKIKKQNNIFFM